MSDQRIVIEEMTLASAALKYPFLLEFPREMFLDKKYIARVMLDRKTGKELLEIGYPEDEEWSIPDKWPVGPN